MIIIIKEKINQKIDQYEYENIIFFKCNVFPYENNQMKIIEIKASIELHFLKFFIIMFVYIQMILSFLSVIIMIINKINWKNLRKDI